MESTWKSMIVFLWTSLHDIIDYYSVNSQILSVWHRANKYIHSSGWRSTSPIPKNREAKRTLIVKVEGQLNAFGVESLVTNCTRAAR
mmetsp:Transcript_21978/g.32101  ORF Transcript_21978/g.32101 Transcript_21978/m.32101 type:complete len:87 (-) Transcript_21978:433-693(-)